MPPWNCKSSFRVPDTCHVVQNTDLLSIHSARSTMFKNNDQSTSRWQVSCWFSYHGLPFLRYSTGFFPCLNLCPLYSKVIAPRCPSLHHIMAAEMRLLSFYAVPSHVKVQTACLQYMVKWLQVSKGRKHLFFYYGQWLQIHSTLYLWNSGFFKHVGMDNLYKNILDKQTCSQKKGQVLMKGPVLLVFH